QDKVLKILDYVCDSAEPLKVDTELLDSGLLDSLAMIELFNELEDVGINLQPTMMDRESFRTPAAISTEIERFLEL
ncbi:MAG: phosphopantetheine-binding protein, partial [Oscillospiraceae bacterium]